MGPDALLAPEQGVILETDPEKAREMAWGDIDAIAARVEEHFAAGANHVCLQVIRGGLGRDVAQERPGWRELARLL